MRVLVRVCVCVRVVECAHGCVYVRTRSYTHTRTLVGTHASTYTHSQIRGVSIGYQGYYSELKCNRVCADILCSIWLWLGSNIQG